MEIVAFVPSRGGSTRVPRKNLQIIGGIPLFLRACYNLNQVLEKESIFVDSDDDEILDMASNHGFRTMRRPADLATNATDGNAFFRWETSHFQSADLFIQHLPPMPFCSKETLENCIDSVLNDSLDSVVCVGKEHFYLWDEISHHPLYDVASIPNSATLPNTVFETMGLYAITGEAHRKSGLRIAGNYGFVELPKIEQIDIDYPEDLEFARIVYKGLSQHSKYKDVKTMIEKQSMLSEIKMVICDIDGVLTDGKMIYTEQGDELKSFHTRDGIAARQLKEVGMLLGIISSGKNGRLIQRRGDFLDFDDVVVTAEKKEQVLENIVLKHGLAYSDLLFIGDDINDLEAMKKSGVSCCPADAYPTVKTSADIVLEKRGGDGCLREVADMILEERTNRGGGVISA